MELSQPTLTQCQYIVSNKQPLRIKKENDGKQKSSIRPLNVCPRCLTPRQQRPCALCRGDDSESVFQDIVNLYKWMENEGSQRPTTLHSFFHVDSSKTNSSKRKEMNRVKDNKVMYPYKKLKLAKMIKGKHHPYKNLKQKKWNAFHSGWYGPFHLSRCCDMNSTLILHSIDADCRLDRAVAQDTFDKLVVSALMFVPMMRWCGYFDYILSDFDLLCQQLWNHGTHNLRDFIWSVSLTICVHCIWCCCDLGWV